MTWKCWAAIGLMVLILGIVVGVLLRRDQNWKLVEQSYLEQLSELREEINEARSLANSRLKVADKYQRERDELAVLLKESRQRVTKIKRPKTLADAVADIGTLKQHIVLVEDTLELATAETLALRDTVRLQDIQIDALEESLTLQEERVELYRKQQRKQKFKTMGLVLGTAAATFAITYGASQI